MRLIDTLPTNYKETISTTYLGVFNGLNEHLTIEDSIEYYLVHSGRKTASSIFKSLKTDGDNPFNNANSLLTNILKSKFSHKWDKIWNDLHIEYDTDVDYKITETNTPNTTNTVTFDTVVEREGDDTNTINYGGVTSTEATNAIKETTTRNGTDDDSRYGFNSDAAVNTDKNVTSETEVFEANPDENINTNTETKSGTDTRTIEVNNSEVKTGTETTTNTGSTTTDIVGRKTPATYLVDREINLRNKYIFNSIVFKDIDSVITSPIYERC